MWAMGLPECCQLLLIGRPLEPHYVLEWIFVELLYLEKGVIMVVG